SFAEHSDESSYRSGCDIGANASHGSIDAAAGERDVCNSTYDSSYTYGSNWGPWGYDSWWSDSRRSDSDCSQRGYAEAEGLAASAGPGQTCTASSEEEGGSAQRYHRRESSSCTDGLHANGPDGIHAFVGTTITEWSECNESFNSTTCYGDTYEQRFASFEWSHNPLGPSPVTIFLP
ncbi:MAG TPA: hypothetical protein VI997_04645, partial [Candidatus Thermoplasmatota archaeon]|nr:hypothetical protein [Candidatus Thermoplasmatota archaeon]